MGAILHCLESATDWERRHLGGDGRPNWERRHPGGDGRPNWERRHLGGDGRPNWERRHLGGATGTTGVPPVVKGTKQTTPNPRAITVRN